MGQIAEGFRPSAFMKVVIFHKVAEDGGLTA